MKTISRLTSEERKEAIIKAVRCTFAEKGFHGTTTRELADAAGVSEALLFKHFPNKEALFAAMKMSCFRDQDKGRMERLSSLEPSASTLVLIVHFTISHIVRACATRDGEQAVQNRLFLRSLAEDGEFARLLLQGIVSCWIPKIQESIRAAIDAGEAVDGPVQPHVAAWFTQHLMTTIKFFAVPADPVVDYGIPLEQLPEQAVWFALRGMGLKEAVIKRYYNPKALMVFDIQ